MRLKEPRRDVSGSTGLTLLGKLWRLHSADGHRLLFMVGDCGKAEAEVKVPCSGLHKLQCSYTQLQLPLHTTYL